VRSGTGVRGQWEHHNDFLCLETRDAGVELGVGPAKKLKWHKSGWLHVTPTPEFDINTAKTGAAGSTMLLSGYDREDILNTQDYRTLCLLNRILQRKRL
jgi:hypothetical protein